MRILSPHTRVKLVNIEEFTWANRHNHPVESDIGWEGFIIGNVVAHEKHMTSNVKPFSQVADGDIIMYTVIDSRGRMLNLLHNEIEVQHDWMS